MKKIALTGIVSIFLIVICMGSTPMNKKDTKTAEEQNKQTYADRQDFQSKADRAMKDLDSKTASLGEKIKAQGSKVSADARKSWKELKAKQNEAKKQLKKVPAATERTWEKVKAETNKALEEARKAYEKAISYFKEKT